MGEWHTSGFESRTLTQGVARRGRARLGRTGLGMAGDRAGDGQAPGFEPQASTQSAARLG